MGNARDKAGAAPPVYTKSFVSAPFKGGAGVAYSEAHGLGEVPKSVLMYATCLVAEDGWSIGDVVILHQNQSTSGSTRVHSLYIDDTTISIKFSSTSIGFVLANKTTGVAANPIDANWDIRWKAFA